MKKSWKKLLPRLFLFLLASLCVIGVYGILRDVVHGAAGDYIPLAPLPGTLALDKTTSLKDYLPGIFKLAIGIAGVLAVIEIIVGGLQYMSTDAIGGKSAGRERVTAAIGGLLLALGAYIILNTISTNFVNLNITIKPVDITATEPPPGPKCSLFVGDDTCGCEGTKECVLTTRPCGKTESCPSGETHFGTLVGCALKYELCRPD